MSEEIEKWLHDKAAWIVRSELPVDTDEEWNDSVEFVLSQLKEAWEDGESEAWRVP